MIEDGDSLLSVILFEHPKLRNDLRRTTIEEIGFRTDAPDLDGADLVSCRGVALKTTQNSALRGTENAMLSKAD